jgi:hypothetical protein
MPRMIEAEAKISAIDATGRTFEDISKKVKSLQSAFKSLQGITSSGVGRVNKTIGTLHNTMRTLKPAAEAAGGAGGLHEIQELIRATVRATTEQAHEAVRMNVSGMSESEIAEAEKLSGELSERYRSLSKTTIMHSLRNMRAIVGTYEEAAKILDPVLKLRVAAQGAHPEHAEELAEDFDKLVKGMEIKGVTMDPDKFKSYMQGMAKAINVFGDTLRPTDYYEMFKYGRQSTQALSEKFQLETAPTLAQELGGSSAGKAMSSFYQAIVGGRIKEQSVKEMEKLGLINEDKVVRTKTGSIKGLLPGGVVGADLAASDPYAWVNEKLLPGLKSHGITSQEDIQATIATIFQQGTAAQMASLFATQQARIEKDWNLVHGAKGLEAADTFQAKDPFIAWAGMTEQFKNLLAIAGGPLAQPAADGLNAIASGIVALEKAATDHPDLAATSLLGGAAGGTVLSGYLGYRGLKGVLNRFGRGAPAAAEEAALAAEGPSFLGTVLAGTRFGAPGAVGDNMMRGGAIYGGGPELLDAARNHKLRSYFNSQFGIGEPDGAAPAVPMFPASVPMGSWAPASSYAAAQVPAPEVKGSADLNVNVQVEPSDSFIGRIVQAIRNEINVFGNGASPGAGVGTAGSTGLSMPEAGPQP